MRYSFRWRGKKADHRVRAEPEETPPQEIQQAESFAPKSRLCHHSLELRRLLGPGVAPAGHIIP